MTARDQHHYGFSPCVISQKRLGYRIDNSGERGVGGDILVVVPGFGAIATLSPPLDGKGSSVRVALPAAGQ